MDKTNKRYITSRGNLLALFQAVQSYGVDPHAIFREGELELQSDAQNYHISGNDIDRMVCMAVKSTGDEAFGLRMVDYIQPNSYHALGVALLYSGSLRSYCERTQRYFKVITTLDQISFVESPDECYLSMVSQFDYSAVAGRVNADTWAGYFVKSMRQVCGPMFNPQRMDLIWTPPVVLKPDYDKLFRCPINYSAKELRVYLDPGELDVPLPSANTLLAHQSDIAVADYLLSMDSESVSSRVYSKMIDLLPTGNCDRERVARALNLTVRTMHNRLEKEGATYKSILEETRQELASSYLQSVQYSVSDVAYLLGYMDVGNFSRAFKRWTGVSPRAYMKSKQ